MSIFVNFLFVVSCLRLHFCELAVPSWLPPCTSLAGQCSPRLLSPQIHFLLPPTVNSRIRIDSHLTLAMPSTLDLLRNTRARQVRLHRQQHMAAAGGAALLCMWSNTYCQATGY